jgi:hypothetical protein
MFNYSFKFTIPPMLQWLVYFLIIGFNKFFRKFYQQLLLKACTLFTSSKIFAIVGSLGRQLATSLQL